MKAIILNKYGGPNVLTYGELERPEPKPGEVLVKVYNVSVNVTLDPRNSIILCSKACALAPLSLSRGARSGEERRGAGIHKRHGGRRRVYSDIGIRRGQKDKQEKKNLFWDIFLPLQPSIKYKRRRC